MATLGALGLGESRASLPGAQGVCLDASLLNDNADVIAWFFAVVFVCHCCAILFFQPIISIYPIYINIIIAIA